MGNRVAFALLSLFFAGQAQAQGEGRDYSNDDRRVRNFMEMQKPTGEAQETHLLLDQQTREMESGQSSLSAQEHLQTGKDRAAQMVEILKKSEMEKALKTVTKKGKQALQEDPSLRTPLGVLAGAVGLWVGKSVRLMTGDFITLYGRVEGRARATEFSMESPFLNGKFRLSADDGVEIHVNRKISSIDTQAEANYNTRNRSFSTQIRKSLAPNLDFTFGASQLPDSNVTDGNARLEYRYDF
jgi:hypothetical protein